MTEDAFRHSIRSGLGRAILHARRNDITEFRDLILDACLHCYAVDPQFEGTRAPYMFDLVKLTADPEFYYGQILQSLEIPGDNWDVVQRFRLASYLALDGDERAKASMYRNFDPGPRMVESVAVDFVRMDGIAGLLFTAEREGALIRSNPDTVDMGFLFSYAAERLGEEQVLQALRDAAESSVNIAAYLAASETSQERHAPSREIVSFSYAQLKPQLVQLKSYWIARWGDRATNEDLLLAAADLLQAQSRDERLACLSIFRRRAFPLPHAGLLQMASSSDEQLATAAATALSHIEHADVRRLAFQLVESGAPGRWEAIAMLDRNWSAGDHRIALAWFEQEPDRPCRHVLGMDLRALWENHPDADSESEMLLSVYENGPCSTCREFVVERMLELRCLPESIRKESSCDANPDIKRRIAEALPE